MATATLEHGGSPVPPRRLKAAPDERLVQRLRAGDERAFDDIYDRYHRPLLSFCRHMLGTREEAEDALQQVFVSAHRQLLRDDRPIQLRAWLYAVARNRCLSVLRARRETVALDELPEPTGDGLAVAAQVERRQDLQDILADLARLPEDQRAALVLAELDDLTHEEIAAALDVRRDKVKALVFQARESLMGYRQARDADCGPIREQLATLRGGALRRASLQRHVAVCAGCAAFKGEVARQRAALGAVLPVVPALTLRDQILAAVHAPGLEAGAAGVVGVGGAVAGLGGGGAGAGAAAGAGGAAAAAAGAGGVATGSGVLALVGSSGVLVKTLAVVAVAATAGGGAVAVQRSGGHGNAPARTTQQQPAPAAPQTRVVSAPSAGTLTAGTASATPAGTGTANPGAARKTAAQQKAARGASRRPAAGGGRPAPASAGAPARGGGATAAPGLTRRPARTPGAGGSSSAAGARKPGTGATRPAAKATTAPAKSRPAHSTPVPAKKRSPAAAKRAPARTQGASAKPKQAATPAVTVPAPEQAASKAAVRRPE